tara:strand:- start:3356 stop:4279 length:924 start_codon:yes stop_codon:yes gene_type:complete
MSRGKLNALQVAEQILGARAQVQVNLGAMTTYRVGGDAALYVVANTHEDLAKVGEARNETELPVLVIGKGSNLLVADDGFPGIVVSLGSDFSKTEFDRSACEVEVGGTVALPALARRCVAAGLSGFEWAVGVPGSIGGAVRMNAGGHGSDMQACVRAVKIFDLHMAEVKMVVNEDLSFGYRHSALRQGQIVLEASLQLADDHDNSGERMLDEIVRWRRDNQPGGQNAGSVFVNPSNETSAELIDRLGLKGFRVGSAQVSAKHANFVQADVGGSANDVDAVITAVAQRVYAETGIGLRTEIQRVGFED